MTTRREAYARIVHAWDQGPLPAADAAMGRLAALLARTAATARIEDATWTARGLPWYGRHRLEMLRVVLDRLAEAPQWRPEAGRVAHPLHRLAATTREEMADLEDSRGLHVRWLAFEALTAWQQLPAPWCWELLATTAGAVGREQQRLAWITRHLPAPPANWSLDRLLAGRAPRDAAMVLGGTWTHWAPAARQQAATPIVAALPTDVTSEDGPRGLLSPDGPAVLLQGLLDPTTRSQRLATWLEQPLAEGAYEEARERQGWLALWILERWQAAGPPLTPACWAPLLRQGSREIREQAVRRLGGGAPAGAPAYPGRTTVSTSRPLRLR